MRTRPAWWVRDQYRYERVHADELAVEISCRLMDRLVRVREEYRVQVVVGMQYGAAEAAGKAPPWYGPPVLECAKGRGFKTVDTYPPLKALADQDPRRFSGLWVNEGGQLGHMSAAGNGLIAALYRDVLVTR